MTGKHNDWIFFGSHHMRLESPDQVHLVWNGDVTAEHVLAAYETFESLGQPRLYLMSDVTRSGTPSEHARKTLVQDKRLRMIYAMACIGASFPMQIVTNLMIRAGQLFRGDLVKATFARDEAEARAWLSAQRTLTKASTPTGPPVKA